MNRDALISVCPNIALYYDGLVDAANRYQINTPLRQAHWLAQLAHESAKFGTIIENLSYSANGLGKIFKKYFPTPALQAQYAKQPEAIANVVYANRLGNGNTASGEGWRYRGGGLIQLTGKYNYRLYSQMVFGDERLVNNPDIIRDKRSADSRYVAAIIGGAYWSRNGLNSLADSDNVKAVTKKINGGYNGLAERIDLTERFKRALGSSSRISENGVIENTEVNPEIVSGMDNPNVRPDIMNGEPPVGVASDYAPRQAEISRPSLTLFAPWPNRRPDHEPWPRQLVVDSTVNEKTDNYLRNVNQYPQYADDDQEDHAGQIGRVEGDETIERGDFWKR